MKREGGGSKQRHTERRQIAMNESMEKRERKRYEEEDRSE